MNTATWDILLHLSQTPYQSQRMTAECSQCSVGAVNKAIRCLKQTGYLGIENELTPKARSVLSKRAPKRAVILAAGYGLRMLPVNADIPKGLLIVKGQALIERLIEQLHQVSISEIYVVVGFMKERYEYLIDKYGVRLLVNVEYTTKNNLHSLKYAANYLSNAYILPCDIRCEENPFRPNELYSWYMVTDAVDANSSFRVNRKMSLVSVKRNEVGCHMLGICYLLEEQASLVRDKVKDFCLDPKHNQSFWEETLCQKNGMILTARIFPSLKALEINTYEQLREADEGSEHLQSDAIRFVTDTFHTDQSQITNVQILKKGMTNRSFLFTYHGKKYIMRIPGVGTNALVNRRHEADVYHALAQETICDTVLSIDAESGYKVTEFWEDARVCRPDVAEDVYKCMQKLHAFHERKLRVNHEFSLFGQIDFYESLWGGKRSAYDDYDKTKADVLSLKPYIDAHMQEKVLCHIDAVPDNFLFITNGFGQEEIRLIDWEYAGMQEPSVDIAMFCIYSLYDKHQVDAAIDAYYNGCVSPMNRSKVYCYIAICGLLWSNWCEYKRTFGIEFGEYSLRQYRFAKDYVRVAQMELDKNGENV